MSILHFPGEEELSNDVHRFLATEFDFARRLYGYWVTHPKDIWLSKSTLPGHTLDLAMILNVQLYRQFRSVYEECSRCEAFCGSIVSRSLFETVIALLFALKPRVNIIVEPVMQNGAQIQTASGVPKWRAKPTSAKSPRGKSNYLSREMRAHMYFAHVAFSDDTWSRKSKRKPGLKRFGSIVARNVSPAIITHFENLIGPQWTYILKDSHGYSGLSLATLVSVLDKRLLRWYETIYHFQSRMVHANDAMRHVKDNAHGKIEPVCLSSHIEVSATMQTAITMFLIAMILMHGEIGFGPGMGMAVDGFKKEFAQVFGGA